VNFCFLPKLVAGKEAKKGKTKLTKAKSEGICTSSKFSERKFDSRKGNGLDWMFYLALIDKYKVIGASGRICPGAKESVDCVRVSKQGMVKDWCLASICFDFNVRPSFDELADYI